MALSLDKDPDGNNEDDTGTHLPSRLPSSATMNADSLQSVSQCVDALIASYRNAIRLLQKIRAESKGSSLRGGPGAETAAFELEQSLHQGDGNVNAQYDRHIQRFGAQFAQGDRIATVVLEEIGTLIQRDVIANLESCIRQRVPPDHAALQDVSDSSQDQCVLALMQLEQRIIKSGSRGNPAPLPARTAGSDTKNLPLPPGGKSATGRATSWSGVSSTHSHNDPSTSQDVRPSYSTNKPPGSSRSPRPPVNPSTRARSRTTSERSGAEDRLFSEVRSPMHNQYAPMATTVTRSGPFGIGKRTKVEPVVMPPENPLVDEYLTTAILDEYKCLGRLQSSNSVTTRENPSLGRSLSGANTDANSSNLPSSHDRGEKGSLSSPNSSQRLPPVHNAIREVLTSNRSLGSINPHDSLPGEMNNYGGFCKGAWRQQIGDRKRAMEERVRPGGMYSASKYWQCKQCKFEGRLVAAADKKAPSRYDTRVFRLVDGIQFRWEFMFKSHIHQKDPQPDPTKSMYGCIFCCSEGRETPIFDGIEAFMLHLIEHRDPLPTGEVLYRMNCLVGRQAGADEDFDINFVSREGGWL